MGLTDGPTVETRGSSGNRGTSRRELVRRDLVRESGQEGTGGRRGRPLRSVILTSGRGMCDSPR